MAKQCTLPSLLVNSPSKAETAIFQHQRHIVHVAARSFYSPYILKGKQNIFQVSEHYILPFDTCWAPGGVRIGGDRSHKLYLDRMGKQVHDVIRRRLLDSFREENAKEADVNSKLFDEVSEHVLFFQER